jgi:hypothetical protein
MRTMTKISFVLSLGLLLGVATARADIPKTINFQGRLSDASGTPLSGTHSVVFRIVNAPTLGTACFTETQSALPVNNGLFKANIGSATSGGIAGCSFADAYYLEVQVDGDAPMTPRLTLTAAAYSFSTDRLDGKDSTEFYQRNATTGDVQVTGSVGAGTTSPSQRVDAIGYVKGTQLCIGTACKSSWPNAGTVTSVSAGTGISLSQSPLTSAGTISVNSGAVQLRVTGTCGANQVIKSIASNGTVACSSLSSSVQCVYSGRVYTPGAKCYTGSSGTSPFYTYYYQICGSNGSWSNYSSSSYPGLPSC